MKHTMKFAVIAATMVLASCGGGGGGGSSAPATQAPTSQAPTTQAPVEKSWKVLDSISVQYSGTVLADAVVQTTADSNLLVFSGPNMDNWPNNCPPVGFKALTIASTGKVTDSTGALNQTSTAIHPRALVTGDFNGDGRGDMFFANHGCDQNPYPGEKNSLFTSNGNSFTDVSTALPNVIGFTHTASAGDVRKNGKQDIFVGIINMTDNPGLADQYKGPNTNGTMVGSYMLRNDGAGNFTYDNVSLPAEIANPPQTGLDHLWATSSAFADVNGDGFADLIIGGNQIAKTAGSVYLNNGAGSFNTAAIKLPSGLFGDFNSITVSITPTDVDNDGKIDLLLSQTQASLPYYGAGKVQVLRNTGSGTFADATAEIIPNQKTNRGWVQWLHMADINSDGALDLVLETDNPQDDDVVAYTRTGTSFTAVERAKLPTSIVSLRPLKFDNRAVLVSMRKTTGNVAVTVYEYK